MVKPLKFIYSILANEHLGDRLDEFEARARREIDEFGSDGEVEGKFLHTVAMNGEFGDSDTGLFTIDGLDRETHFDCYVRLARFTVVGTLPDDHPVKAFRGKELKMPQAVDAPGNDEFPE